MDFSAALTVVRGGGTITRPCWPGFSVGVVAFPEKTGIMPFFAIRSPEGKIMSWVPSQKEMFADDWVEVEGGGVAGHG